MAFRRLVVLGFAAILLVAACGGGDEVRPIEITPKANGQIAFVASSASSPKNEDIYVSSPDGSGKRKLISSPFVDTSPVWSPDGRKIAFVRARAPMIETSFENSVWRYADIYVANADGSGVKNITKLKGGESSPTWSPDSRKIAFVRAWGRTTQHAYGEALVGPNVDVYVVNANGSGMKNVTKKEGEETSPTWSADAKKIAFLSEAAEFGFSIQAVNADGTGVTKLFDRNGAYIGDPQWSPDNTRILFVLDSGGHVGRDTMVMNADGSHLTQLTEGYGDYVSARWAPDGRTIVLAHYADCCEGPDVSFISDILFMSSGGGRLRSLRLRELRAGAEYVAGLTWSPDGRQIAYSLAKYPLEKQAAGGSIYVMNADGTKREAIAERSPQSSPSYGEPFLSWQPLPR